MATIFFLDDSFPFTGASLLYGPLGGIQTATVMLAETLAARGHQVTVWGMQLVAVREAGVAYRPLADARGQKCDLAIANCAPKLFRFCGPAARRALWLHGPARYLRKPRHAWPYLRFRPEAVFLGAYHRATWPRILPLFHPAMIPHAVGAPFLTAPLGQTPPPPRALFFSNPRRHLGEVLELWAQRIHPACPAASLHVYAGRGNYGARRDDKLDAALAAAKSFEKDGVVLHDPLPKEGLLAVMRESRVMLYLGDLGETYCFAAAEAQAAGVPLVTAGIGALAERVQDGQTGFLCSAPEDLANATLRLLTDDTLWAAQHNAARERALKQGWDAAATAWEAHFGLLP